MGLLEVEELEEHVALYTDILLQLSSHTKELSKLSSLSFNFDLPPSPPAFST